MTGFVTKKISRQKSLGAILKAARAKADASIEQAEIGTKVRARYLAALEEGQFDELPAEAYNVGFVRSYAQFLKLDPDKIVQLYREERSRGRVGANHHNVLAPKKMGDWKFLVTPKIIGIATSFLLFGGVVSYIVIQVNNFAKPPILQISNVPSEFTSDQDLIQLQGRTSVGSNVLMNAESIYVKADGSFAQDIQLSPGVNEILVLARSRAQKESKEIVKVLYKPDLAKAGQSGTTD